MRGAKWLLALGGTVREEADISRYSRTIVARVRIGRRLYEGAITVHDEDLIVDRGSFVFERIDDMLFKVARSAHGWRLQGKTPSWYAGRKLREAHWEDCTPYRAEPRTIWVNARGQGIRHMPLHDLARLAWEAHNEARLVPEWDMVPDGKNIPWDPRWARLCAGSWRTR